MRLKHLVFKQTKGIEFVSDKFRSQIALFLILFQFYLQIELLVTETKTSYFQKKNYS